MFFNGFIGFCRGFFLVLLCFLGFYNVFCRYWAFTVFFTGFIGRLGGLVGFSSCCSFFFQFDGFFLENVVKNVGDSFSGDCFSLTNLRIFRFGG